MCYLCPSLLQHVRYKENHETKCQGLGNSIQMKVGSKRTPSSFVLFAATITRQDRALNVNLNLMWFLIAAGGILE